MLHDLRYGMRILRKNPTFALVAILALALGTGANAAIFQLVNALRLRSLPVEQPNELLSIGIDQHGKGRVGRGYPGRSIFTEPLWQEIRSQQQAFASLFAWGNGRWDLSAEGEAVPAFGFYVSGGFFDALGVHARLGRLLTELDDQKGCGSPGGVLSHGFWQARLGGHPAVIGQTIMLDRRPFQVIGVTPAGFFGVEVGRTFDVALPLCAEALLRGEQAGTGRRAVWWLDIMGRLKPGWTVERAQAQVAAISPGVFQATVAPTYSADWAKNYTSFTLTARPAGTGVSNLRSAYATQLWALLGATGLVLLLTCLNLANLMLARSTVRGQEVAVRLAIGASRRRVVRQMLSESVLLAGLGAVGGLLLARWISQTLVLFLNARGNRIFLDLTPDWRVFAFLATVTRLQQVPGVRHAAEALIVPLDGSDWNGRIVTGGAVQDGDAHFDEVGGNYFRVMGTPLLAGRTFDGRDRPDAAKSAIVNETFARRYFQNADPIGKTFQMELPPGSPQPTYHIVGLVRDAKFLEVREERTSAALRFSANESSATFLPIAYLAVSQDSAPPPDLRIVLRSAVPPASLTHALTRAITEVAPASAVSYDAVSNYIDRLLVTERLMAWLSGCFGVLAMLIAAIGLYGVMSYLVTRRRIEIGVRMALGAEPRTIIRMMFAECGVLLAIGFAIGLVLAGVTLRYAAALLYGLTPLDASSFALAISGLGLASVLATWFPARRASRLAPTVALRE